MKKIYLLVFICFFSVYSFAQLEKGSILVGGTIGASFGTKKIQGFEFHSFDVAISPEVGKFYKTNRLVGAGVTFGIGHPDTALRNYSYGAKIFLRQYFPLGKSFYFFAEEGYNREFIDQ